ncbi:MAG: TetR/AcrR family transcriptional regulator [bacterium]
MTEVLSRSKRRKIKTFNRIINASYKIFPNKGLFRATLDEISEEADVGKGTIYRHFRNKMHLIAHLTKKGIDDLLSYCKTEIAEIQDPKEIIKKLIEAHFAFFERRMALFKILFFIRGALQQDFENRYIKEMQSRYKKYISFLADNLDYGIKAGVFRPFNIMNQAYILVGIVNGFISQWIIDERKGTFVEKAGVVAETFLHGIVSNEQKDRQRNKGSCKITQRHKDFQGRGELSMAKKEEKSKKGKKGCGK